MSDTIYCPECGQSLSATARFCGRCGHMLPAVQGTADGGRRTGTQGAAARGVLPLLLGAGVVLVFVGLIVAGWFLGQALVGRGGPGRGNGEEAALVGGDGQEETGGGEEEALPAETALPTVTLAPTETVAPTATDTPKPTATSEPTATLAPTGTPEPTSTATRATTTGALFSEAAFCAEPCSASGSNSSRVFPGGIDIIYAQWRYENVRVGARYERIWESNGQVWAHYDCTWPGPTASLENIQLTDPSGLRSGEWKVTIRIDGEVAMEEAITLTGNSTHWDVPGYFDTCYGRR